MKEITEEQIKSAARKKFGSLTRFAKTADIQALDIYATFRMRDSNYKQSKMQALMQAIKTCNAVRLEKDWKPGLGEVVRSAMLDEFGTITAFCNAHPKFKNYWISLILNNKKLRISNKVQEVLDILKIDLDQI